MPTRPEIYVGRHGSKNLDLHGRRKPQLPAAENSPPITHRRAYGKLAGRKISGYALRPVSADGDTFGGSMGESVCGMEHAFLSQDDPERIANFLVIGLEPGVDIMSQQDGSFLQSSGLEVLGFALRPGPSFSKRSVASDGFLENCWPFRKQNSIQAMPPDSFFGVTKCFHNPGA